MSQRKDILNYMEKGNGITAYRALHLFGCMRLASRIEEIRRTRTVKDRWISHNNKRYKEYYI